MLAAEAEYYRPREFGRTLERLNRLYEKCMQIQDYGKALAAVRELNAVLAMHEPEATKTIRIEGVDDARLKVLVDALAARGQDFDTLANALLQNMAASDGSDILQ